MNQVEDIYSCKSTYEIFSRDVSFEDSFTIESEQTSYIISTSPSVSRDVCRPAIRWKQAPAKISPGTLCESCPTPPGARVKVWNMLHCEIHTQWKKINCCRNWDKLRPGGPPLARMQTLPFSYCKLSTQHGGRKAGWLFLNGYLDLMIYQLSFLGFNPKMTSNTLFPELKTIGDEKHDHEIYIKNLVDYCIMQTFQPPSNTYLEVLKKGTEKPWD